MNDSELFFGIPFGNVLLLLAWVLGSLVVGKLLQVTIRRAARAKRFADRSTLQVFFVSLARPIPFLFFVWGLRFGLSSLPVSSVLEALISDVLAVLLTVAVAFFIYSLIDVINHLLTVMASKTATKLDDMMAPMVQKSLRVVVVVLALVQIAQILSDKPITSILAGLGVGGLAIALAAQETIKNFFGSLVIFADKPFELEERIRVGDFDGFVEEVGFRSTRLRTLDGHLVTIPNGELANLMVENVSKRPHIKRVLELGVTYDTTPEKMEEAKAILADILADHEGQNEAYPPRIYFKSFNSSSLDLEVIYWYHPGQYWAFMEHADYVNREILRRFNEAGIEFAFPTRTLYLSESVSEEGASSAG
ncbi:MAG: hypothetical protein CBE26_02460 [Kiritimatiellaceae bacterium TMED266]|nr:MAG: hypothetical protein CBE26_02460 [Kiritimatiellaceae bacterium TMED266]